MKTKLLLTLGAAGALLTGCLEMHEAKQNTAQTILTGHEGGAYTPRNTTKFALENEVEFVALNKNAQHSVTASGIQKGMTPDGRLEVAVNLRNREERRIQVQVNCIFKDEQGFSVDETPFQNVILSENAQETVKFVSMNNQARKYTIRVREAR